MLCSCFRSRSPSSSSPTSTPRAVASCRSAAWRGLASNRERGSVRHNGTTHYGMSRAEVGWVLEDNGPMVGIAEAIDGEINRIYRIYEKPL